MDKLKENIKKSINDILLDAVILTIVSIIIYIYIKGQLEMYQILAVLYILKLMENIVHIMFLLIKQAIDNNKRKKRIIFVIYASIA